MNRVKEIINKDGVSTFVPQYRVLWMFWCSYEVEIAPLITVELRFNTYDKCKNWLSNREKDRKQSVIIHDV